jgi:hypothetical protein
MNKRVLFSICVLVLGGLNIGAILRSEDPIRDTETSPISYKQKMEEDKDGKKGPLAYSVKYNPRDTFLTTSPVGSKKEESKPASKPEETVPGGTNWWEEAPSGDKAQGTAATDSFSEPIVEENTPDSPQNGSAENAKPEDAQGSKEDYWW